ncbi:MULTISPECIES: RDD family protein [unclassified Luteimonas]|uniref:RDD family protein n=1 Tax=unclassified Luteimonas TaxID=2629088 RepID=UPI0018F10088|nr:MULTISPECIES: RDD family protein [unclassified Luteimonas]MBJ6979163.1 RDD family protein [Luteimonas sp. MC1895]MBJ6985180.1 RDD family protein [Luteimonas sp. MC1750]QQO05833.1 RDD family protein [Luteimonas sp. MC1750]
MRPAGFWRRGAAWSLDALPVGLATLALCVGSMRPASGALAAAWSVLVDALAQRMAGVVSGAMATGAGADAASGAGALLALTRGALRDPALLAAARDVQAALAALAVPPLAVFAALFLAWCVGFEGSSLRATPGKRALGLRVATVAGGDAATGRLLLRFLAGTLSWLSLNVGHLLAAIPPAHAALHDRLSATRVVLAADAPSTMPRWARAWLWLLAAALLLATAWAAAAMGAAMQAALDRALRG